jgi:hypothetical protein
MSHEIECDFVRETDNAVLVTEHNTGERIWFPLSQVEQMHRDKNNRGRIVVSDWIAAEKGLT